MAITDWPSADRPREKLINRGAAAMSDSELLAIFLRTGVTGKSAVDLARDLIDEFGGLRPLLESNLDRFCAGHGLGKAKYALLQAVMEMAKRHLQETLKRGDVLQSPQHTRTYLTSQLRKYQHEVFACLFLDNRHRVISFDEMFHGTINGASVHPREVVKRALGHNAAAVILAHNHPSGVAEPSQADLSLTKRLKQALNLIDVNLLDHFVVGDGEMVSLAERGII